MEFAFLINVEESDMPTDPESAEGQETFAAWMAYNQRLLDGGHLIGGASLLGSDTATVVHRHASSTTVTDGPFAETKEQIGGFYLVRAADLDEAIALVEAMPLPDAAIEIRPLMFRPGS